MVCTAFEVCRNCFLELWRGGCGVRPNGYAGFKKRIGGAPGKDDPPGSRAQIMSVFSGGPWEQPELICRSLFK